MSQFMGFDCMVNSQKEARHVAGQKGYPASPRADTAFGFTAAIPDIDLNLFDGVDVQSPSRYVIATSQELDAGQWTITAKQPDGKGSTALTLAEYSDLIYQ